MTRIAVIADIHGNDHALEAVLADIDAQGVALTVNLGDHLSGPLNAARTADLLMERDFPSVRGNHDRWLLEKEPQAMGDWDRIAHSELEQRHLDWLADLPPTRVVDNDLFLCHATPEDDLTYWLEELLPDGTLRQSPLDRVERYAARIDVPVILCGHTHLSRAVRLRDGRLVVNPGSVGSPAYSDDTPVPHKVEAGTPHARYAILEKSAGGSWDVEFRLIGYDVRPVVERARERGMMECVSALSTGWL